jgi:hypothetical protein
MTDEIKVASELYAERYDSILLLIWGKRQYGNKNTLYFIQSFSSVLNTQKNPQ